MKGGGSGAASPEVPPAEGGGAGDPVRRLSDRLESMLPRVEALAADRARVEETNRAQHQLLEALYARLLQAEASRERWKAAYTHLPPGANLKLAELQERDVVDSETHETLPDSDDSQLKETSEEPNEMELEQNMMQILVKIHCSNFRKKRKIHCLKTIIVDVMGSDTIWDVKYKIQDKEGIPAGQQRLIFGSKLLVGSCTLEEYNIEESSTLTLVLVPQGMHIFVKTLTGKIMSIEVEIEDSIYTVKEKVSDVSGIHPGRQCLIFAGKQLEDDRTLAEYDVYNGSTLYMVVRFPICEKGGMNIWVAMLTGKMMDFVVKGEDSIYSVKAKVFDETGFPPGRQCLIFAGKQLEDGCTLVDCGVYNGSTLHVVFRIAHRGGGIKISVKTRTGKDVIEHACMHPETVDNIKAWIYSELGIPPDQQQLSLGGELLKSDHSIHRSCTLVLQIRDLTDGGASEGSDSAED